MKKQLLLWCWASRMLGHVGEANSLGFYLVGQEECKRQDIGVETPARRLLTASRTKV